MGERARVRVRAAIVLFCSIPLLGQPAPSLLEQHRVRPNDWKISHQIALAYTQAGDFTQASAFYREALRVNPEFVPARKNLATVTWFSGQKAEAEALFRKLLPAIPSDPVPHLYLGIAAAERKVFATAKVHLEKAGDLALRNPEVLPTLAEASLATKDRSIVPVVLKVIPELEPSDAGLRTKLAHVFNRYGEWPATIKLLEAIAAPDLDTTLALAEAFDRQGEPARAYEALAKAVSQNPSDERAYIALAAFASEHRNNRYGLEVLDKGIAQLPDSWLLLLHSGLLLALEGDSAGAEQRFTRAAERSKGSNLAMLAIGVLQLESGRVAEAAATFSRAVDGDPRDGNARYFLALALHRTGEEQNRAGATSSLSAAIEINPKDVKSRLLLGQIHLAAGRLAEAVADLKAALKLDPQNRGALYSLSLACRKEGQTAAADRYMAQFRKVKAEADENASQFVHILKIIR